MEATCRLLLGSGATAREKIALMGRILQDDICRNEELTSLQEVMDEARRRFSRLRLRDKAEAFEYYADELMSSGESEMVEILTRLSLLQSDAALISTPSTSSASTLSLLRPCNRLNGGEWTERSESGRSTTHDDDCIDSAHDVTSPVTRSAYGRATTEMVELLRSSRAKPHQKETYEVEESRILRSLSCALSGVPSAVFHIHRGAVSLCPHMFLSGHSIPTTSTYLSPFVDLTNKCLSITRQLEAMVKLDSRDLSSHIGRYVLQRIDRLRESVCTAPLASPMRATLDIRTQLEEVKDALRRLLILAHFTLHLRGKDVSHCVDALMDVLHSECLLDEHLQEDFESLLTHAFTIIARDALSFMLRGRVSPLGLILPSKHGSMLHLKYAGGREEGNLWRKDYGIRVSSGRIIDARTAHEILAEGTLTIMRERDPNDPLDAQDECGEMSEELPEEVEEKIGGMRSHTVADDIRRILMLLVDHVRSSLDRSSHFERQKLLVGNSLEIVWQTFLLGDRVTRVPSFSDTIHQRYVAIRDAVKNFGREHLLSVELSSSGRESESIYLRVYGALSIVVSSSNIHIYSRAHNLLSKISHVFHQVSQAHRSLLPLSIRSSLQQRSHFLALSEVRHWVSQLASYFCTQTHEIVWKQTDNKCISSCASFDALYQMHRKALKKLAGKLLFGSDSQQASIMLDNSVAAAVCLVDAFIEGDELSVPKHYATFVEAAQMFCEELSIREDDEEGSKAQLLFLLNSNNQFY